MYRRFDPLKDNHIAYFDPAEAVEEFKKLPERPPTPEEVTRSEAFRAIYALNISLSKAETPNGSQARQVIRKFSPTMHVEQGDGDPITREENPNASKPLIEAYTKDGHAGLLARVLVEMEIDPNDKAGMKKIIDFNPEQNAATHDPASITDAAATNAVNDFLEYAESIYGNTSSRGGSISTERRSFLKRIFGKKQSVASVINNMRSNADELKEAYKKDLDSALKTEFLLHALPQMRGKKSTETIDKVAKIVAYPDQSTTTAPQETQHSQD